MCWEIAASPDTRNGGTRDVKVEAEIIQHWAGLHPMLNDLREGELNGPVYGECADKL